MVHPQIALWNRLVWTTGESFTPSLYPGPRLTVEVQREVGDAEDCGQQGRQEQQAHDAVPGDLPHGESVGG